MTTIRRRIRELTQLAKGPVSVTAEITGIHDVSRSYTRLTLVAPSLVAYETTMPADGIKLAVPGTSGGLEMRALTVSGRPAPDTVEIDVLKHAGGLLASWLGTARTGDRIELHAVRREWVLGDGITEHLLIADACALPAASTILRAIPESHRIRAWIQIPHAGDRSLLPPHPGLDLRLRIGDPWSPQEMRQELDAAFDERPLNASTQTWLAAEASSVAEARRCLGGHGQPRDHLFAAAYWKAGRDSTARDDRIRRAYFEAMSAEVDLADPEARTETEMVADGLEGEPLSKP